MRVHLKGINSYTAKLADGTKRTYWYAWKGGPRLQGEPGTPEFIASYNEAAAQKIKDPTGRLLWPVAFAVASILGERRFQATRGAHARRLCANNSAGN